MMPLHPHTPLPFTQKTEKLSTRNRRLPQIPGRPGQPGSGQQPSMANGSAQGLTNSLFGLAKKLTSSTATPTTHTNPQSVMRTSQSYTTLPPLGRVGPKRPGRGARLPQVPQGGVLQQLPSNGGSNRRHLPNRDGYYSRSLENDPEMMMGHQQQQKLDTVLEAGRGVRKLPVPIVKTGSSGRNGGMMNGGPVGNGGGVMGPNSNGMMMGPQQHPSSVQHQSMSGQQYDENMLYDGEPMSMSGPNPMGPHIQPGMGPPQPMGQHPQQQQQQAMMQDTMVNQSMPLDPNQMPNWT